MPNLNGDESLEFNSTQLSWQQFAMVKSPPRSTTTRSKRCLSFMARPTEIPDKYSELACNAQCLAYNPDSTTSSPTLDSLSLFLPANELTFLIGSSGSGKSTVVGGDKEQRLSLSHCRLLRHTNRGAEVTWSFNHTETPHLQTFFCDCRTQIPPSVESTPRRIIDPAEPCFITKHLTLLTKDPNALYVPFTPIDSISSHLNRRDLRIVHSSFNLANWRY